MITYDDILKANEDIKSIDVKGKNYVMVNERVKGLRKVLPGATIKTEILNDTGSEATMRASIYDGENLLATGTAHERKDASFINKTSYIENCETSAVGRALGFLGIGIDDSLGTADEIANAILQQGTAEKKISKDKALALAKLMQEKGRDTEKMMKHYGVTLLTDLTEAQHAEIVQLVNK